MGGALLVGSVVAGGAGGCETLAPNLSRVIGLGVNIADSVEEADTLRGRATLFTAAGDSTPGPVYWSSFDTTVLAVADSARGVFTGRAPGTTSLVARSGSLRSPPLPIVVTEAADTLVAMSSLVDSVSVGARDSVSDPLAVGLDDTVTNAPSPPSLSPLSNRPVVFAIAPAPRGTELLVTTDTAHSGSTVDTVRTSAGVAAVQVRYLGGPLPDSIVVIARAQHAVGTPVAGSPVRFVVHLGP